MASIAWLVVFVLLAAIELVTWGLTSIWFAIGALAACVASWLGGNLVVQAVVFIAVSVLVLIFVRPFAVKYINSDPERTNVESILGKTGMVSVEISNVNAEGTVIIDGMDWTARSKSGVDIPAGTMVKVQSVEGVKVIVEKA